MHLMHPYGLDALFLWNNKWILPAPIASTPFSCFSYVQELRDYFAVGLRAMRIVFLGIRISLPSM